MGSRYLWLEHSSGLDFIVDTVKARYDRLCKGFLNKIRLRPSFIKHITLTQRVESYKPKFLNNFFNSVRRFYRDVIYLWTVEVQEKRAEVYGERVLHWHVIMAFPFDIKFTRDDVLRLQRYWKYGNLDVKPVRCPTLSYLTKYITKALDVGIDGIRRIGSSRIEAWLKQGWRSLVKALEFFAGIGADLNDFWWYRGDAFVYEFPEYKRGRVYVYRRPREWRLKYAFDDLPF